jgi:hypothetical protein
MLVQFILDVCLPSICGYGEVSLTETILPSDLIRAHGPIWNKFYALYLDMQHVEEEKEIKN